MILIEFKEGKMDKMVNEDQRNLTPREIEHFKKLLLEKRKNILLQAKATIKEKDGTELRAPDEVDLASAEYDHSLEYRLRDREKFLLRKIDKALERIEVGEYNCCEICGDSIGKKRLEARPETTMCIACKEDQERNEKMYLKKREMRQIEF